MALNYKYDPKSWNQQIKLVIPTAVNAGIVTSGLKTEGIITLDGSLISSGVYFNDTPAFLNLVCIGDETETLFTFTGKDQSGREYTYETYGVNATSLIIPVPFSFISEDGILIDKDTTAAISIGTVETTATPWCPIDTKRSVDSLGLAVFLNSSPNVRYTLQYTNDPYQGSEKGYPTPPVNFLIDTTLVNLNATAYTGLNNPAQACRIIINSATSSSGHELLFQLQQQGDMTSAPPAIGV